MFAIGPVYITGAAREALERNKQDFFGFVSAHANEYWEDWRDGTECVGADDKPVVSSYKLKDHTVIWVATDPSRSATLIALPYETAYHMGAEA